MMWITAGVLAAMTIFAVVRIARTSLTQIAIGVVLALALDPVVTAASRRLKLKRGLSVAVVGFGFLAGAALAIALLGPPARDQAGRFTEDLPKTIQEFEDLPVVGSLVERYDIETKARNWVNDLPDRLDDQTVSRTANRLLSNVAGMLTVAGTVIAVLLDGPRLIARFRRLFRDRPERLEQVDRIGHVLYVTLGQYFGGSLTVAMMMGTYVLIVALVLSIPLAPLAALWATFTNLIPQVGGFLGGSFLVLLALSRGPVVAIAAAVAFVVYMNIENNVIQPTVIGQSVNLSPPTTMLAAFVGGAVAGIPGALVATPTVGVVKRLYLEYRHGEVAVSSRQSFIGRLKNIILRRRSNKAAATP